MTMFPGRTSFASDASAPQLFRGVYTGDTTDFGRIEWNPDTISWFNTTPAPMWVTEKITVWPIGQPTPPVMSPHKPEVRKQKAIAPRPPDTPIPTRRRIRLLEDE